MFNVTTKQILKYLRYTIDGIAIFTIFFILLYPEQVGIWVGIWFDDFLCGFLNTISAELPK